MTEVYTYKYISQLLSKVSKQNKLNWENFLKVFVYVETKLKAMRLIKKRTILYEFDKALVNDVIRRLEIIISNNLVEDIDTKKQIGHIVRNWKNNMVSLC